MLFVFCINYSNFASSNLDRYMDFYKYQGTGNDFVMIDNRAGEWNDLSIENIQKLCDRRFGIGADGLIKINAIDGYDFEVDYYNSDGSKSFCGNGARCSVAFAFSLIFLKVSVSLWPSMENMKQKSIMVL